MFSKRTLPGPAGLGFGKEGYIFTAGAQTVFFFYSVCGKCAFTVCVNVSLKSIKNILECFGMREKLFSEKVCLVPRSLNFQGTFV